MIESENAARNADVFVSVAGPDRPWARWIGQQLLQAGYSVEYDEWSWAPGSFFIERMEQALTASKRMIAIVSPFYLDRNSYGFIERIEAVRIAHRRRGFLIPVLVADCALPPILGGIIHISLVNLDEESARERLLGGLEQDFRARNKGISPWPGRPPSGAASTQQAAFPIAIQANEDMRGRDLLAINLGNSILQGVDFSNADLREANFAAARLTDVNFKGADLRNVDFTDARLANPQLDGARLEGSQWRRALLVEPSLEGNVGATELSAACVLPQDSPTLQYGPSGIVTMP
jgi:uncharacterized protein YjbI with pentapeptide repeats